MTTAEYIQSLQEQLREMAAGFDQAGDAELAGRADALLNWKISSVWIRQVGELQRIWERERGHQSVSKEGE